MVNEQVIALFYFIWECHASFSHSYKQFFLFTHWWLHQVLEPGLEVQEGNVLKIGTSLHLSPLETRICRRRTIKRADTDTATQNCCFQPKVSRLTVNWQPAVSWQSATGSPPSFPLGVSNFHYKPPFTQLQSATKRWRFLQLWQLAIDDFLSIIIWSLPYNLINRYYFKKNIEYRKMIFLQTSFLIDRKPDVEVISETGRTYFFF